MWSSDTLFSLTAAALEVIPMLTDMEPVSIPHLLEGRLLADNSSAVNCHPRF